MRETPLIGAAALGIALSLAGACSGERDGGKFDCLVYAIEYAHSPKLRKSSLVHEAPKDRFAEFSWFSWLVVGRQRVVLVDTGFDDVEAAEGFGVERFHPVHELLGGLGLRPDQVTDVIITHLHFDHAANGRPYANATFWIQRAEIEWARGRVSEEQPRRGGVRLEDVQHLDALKDQGRLIVLDGDAEIAEGIVAHRGGGHTPGLQWVEIRTGSAPGTIVLASDNAYLYENLSERRPTASTRDTKGDQLLIERLLGTASSEKLVIPGHDPTVMQRFPAAAPFVVEIK